MKDEDLEKLLYSKNIDFEIKVDLKKKTWIQRGGTADYFIKPKQIEELQLIMSYVYKKSIRFLLIGSTSNLYILNSTNIPVVISTLKCNYYEIKDNMIVCDCGVQVSKLARQMINRGISGFEFLTKLPGTIGAAIYNNSSVKSQYNSITNLLIDVDIITKDGIKNYNVEDLHFTFRSSDLKSRIIEGVILKARLKLEHRSKEEMEKIAYENEIERNKILEGPAKNLGCTVNRMFINGSMPKKYTIPLLIFKKIVSLFIYDEIQKKKLSNRLLLFMSGHKKLIPYVSDKQLITFIWKDEKADLFFEEYLQFMREVCKTDRVEIEIIR